MQSGQTCLALRFNPRNMSREYGSNIYFIKQGTTDRIQFRTSIIYAGLFMDKYPIFHLYKHDIYINTTVPDEYSYRLAEACSKTFYPIVVICNSKGEIIALRSDLIKTRWKQQSPFIKREYGGKYAKNYINQTEENLQSDQKIYDLILRDLFFQSFFSLSYNNTQEISIENNIPVIPFSKSIQTKSIQKLKVHESKNILIEQKGIIDDEQYFNYDTILNSNNNIGSGKLKGDFSVAFELNKHCIIDSIQSYYNVKKENGDILMNIKMESYYLSEYPLQSIEDTDTISLGQKMLKRSKTNHRKSFWQRFNDYLNEPI